MSASLTWLGEEDGAGQRYCDGGITAGVEGVQLDESIEPGLPSTVCTGRAAGAVPDVGRTPGHPSCRSLGASAKA